MPKARVPPTGCHQGGGSCLLDKVYVKTAMEIGKEHISEDWTPLNLS
jgi:hypothetical protein